MKQKLYYKPCAIFCNVISCLEWGLGANKSRKNRSSELVAISGSAMGKKCHEKTSAFSIRLHRVYATGKMLFYLVHFLNIFCFHFLSLLNETFNSVLERSLGKDLNHYMRQLKAVIGQQKHTIGALECSSAVYGTGNCQMQILNGKSAVWQCFPSMTT